MLVYDHLILLKVKNIFNNCNNSTDVACSKHSRNNSHSNNSNSHIISHSSNSSSSNSNWNVISPLGMKLPMEPIWRNHREGTDWTTTNSSSKQPWMHVGSGPTNSNNKLSPKSTMNLYWLVSELKNFSKHSASPRRRRRMMAKLSLLRIATSISPIVSNHRPTVVLIDPLPLAVSLPVAASLLLVAVNLQIAASPLLVVASSLLVASSSRMVVVNLPIVGILLVAGSPLLVAVNLRIVANHLPLMMNLLLAVASLRLVVLRGISNIILNSLTKYIDFLSRRRLNKKPIRNSGLRLSVVECLRQVAVSMKVVSFMMILTKRKLC
jgi:hypothetical protein